MEAIKTEVHYRKAGKKIKEKRKGRKKDSLSKWESTKMQHKYKCVFGGARSVMVIVVGNGHADTSSNPGRD